jgi:hypothetical protein
MLKLYHRRPDIAAVAVIEEETVDEDNCIEHLLPDNDEMLKLPRLEAKESVDDVQVHKELDSQQRSQVKHLLNSYRDVLTDVPGRISSGKQETKVTDDKPIRCKQYPIPHAIRNEAQKKIETILKLRIVSKNS